jgi:hypothetical protein
MKTVSSIMRRVFLGTTFLVSCYTVLAQTEGENTASEDLLQQHPWYNSPWLWVTGAALFIVLLIFLSRGEKKD